MSQAGEWYILWHMLIFNKNFLDWIQVSHVKSGRLFPSVFNCILHDEGSSSCSKSLGAVCEMMEEL